MKEPLVLKVSSSTYRKIVIGSAIYDVFMSAPYATPWSFSLLHGQLSATNQRLGGAPFPVFEPFHLLFTCLLGSLALVWSVLRLRDPQARFGRYDGVGRFLFSTWMAWALLETGAPLLWLFLVPELLWGIVQWLPIAHDNTEQAASRADR